MQIMNLLTKRGINMDYKPYPHLIQYTHSPGIFVSDYYFMDDKYTCYRPSGTKDWLIMYTLSGKGIVINGQDQIECCNGDITIIPPGTPQHYFTAKGYVWEKIWAHFFPRPHWMEWIQLPKTNAPILHKNIEEPFLKTNIENAFKRLLSYNSEALTLNYEDIFLNAIEEIILLVNRDSMSNVLDRRVKEVLSILTKRYAEPIVIEELAQHVNLSPSRLSHLFKEQVGDSIIETLMTLRIKQASRYLLFTNRSITDIAYETGFNSPEYFTRTFTKYYGTSPNKYRKAQWISSTK